MVLGQIGEEPLDLVQAGLVVRGREMGHPGKGVVDFGPAQLLGGDLLAGDGLDHLGTGDVHVGGLLHHDDEVGHSGGVDRPAGAGTHDGRDLGHHSRGVDVALENLAVTAQGFHPLLDAGSARIVEAQDGRAVAHGQVHDLADLLSEDPGQGASEDGEVLRENVNQPVVYLTPAGDHPVAGDLFVLHAEIGAAVHPEPVEFLEGAFVQEVVDPLPGGHLALGVLGVYPVLAASEEGLRVSFLQLSEFVSGVHFFLLGRIIRSGPEGPPLPLAAVRNAASSQNSPPPFWGLPKNRRSHCRFSGGAAPP